MKTFVGHLSFWFAVLGALMLAIHMPFSGWGYIPFLLSNIATLYLLKGSDASKAITWQTWMFMIMNVIGIVRWLC